MSDLHRLAEERSLAIHHEVCHALRRDPTLLQRARDRLDQWATRGTMSPYYVERWNHLLSGPLDEILRVLCDPGEDARALRQASPFVGIIDARDKGAVYVTGRESPSSLYDRELSSMDIEGGFDQQDSRGFIQMSLDDALGARVTEEGEAEMCTRVSEGMPFRDAYRQVAKRFAR